MFILKKLQKKPYKKKKISINNKLKNSLCGTYYIKALENGNITFKQLEAMRKVLSKDLKKISKIWIRIKPKMPITLKLGDKRMGKGKGDILNNIFKVYAGSVLFEIEGFNKKKIIILLKVAKKKLPIKTKLLLKKSL